MTAVAAEQWPGDTKVETRMIYRVIEEPALLRVTRCKQSHRNRAERELCTRSIRLSAIEVDRTHRSAPRLRAPLREAELDAPLRGSYIELTMNE